MTTVDVGVYIAIIGLLLSIAAGFLFVLKQRKFPRGHDTNRKVRYIWPFISFVATSSLMSLGFAIAGVYGSINQTDEDFIINIVATTIGCTGIYSLLLMGSYLLGLWFQGFGYR